ncbi:shikimate kinase [Caenispirillum bisanense]
MSGVWLTPPHAEAPLALHRTVVLVGLMGAGKSVVGRRLAGRLHVPFVDADTEIEKAAGQSIADIFANLGEDAFRAGERKVMARLLDGEPCVLAAGGGAFMAEDTRRRIRARGISVWLRADLDLLVRRTAGRAHRPLLNQGDPREKLRALIDLRYPVYAEADITIDAGEESPEVTTDRVLAALRDFIDRRGAVAPEPVETDR